MTATSDPSSAAAHSTMKNGAGGGKGSHGNGASGLGGGCVGALRSISRAVDSGMQRAFFKLGWAVASRPWTVVIIMCIVTAACATGMTQTESEARSEIVWNPENSDAGARLEQIKAVYGDNARTSTFYVRTKSPGGNVLTAAALKEVVQLSADIESATAEAAYKSDPSRTWTWSDLCLKRSGVCWLSSVADVFYYDDATIDSAAAGTGGIPQYLFDKQQAGTLRDRFGAPMALTSVLGGESVTAGGKVESATVLVLTFVLENRQYKEDGTNVDPPAEAFEQAVLAKVGKTIGEQSSYSVISIIPNTPYGNRSESSAAIRGDLGLVSSSIMVIVVYLGSQLGGCSKVQSRVALAIGAAATVGFALLIANGLGSLLTFSSSVHSVLPFLLAGIGVDDIFVITNEFALAGKKLREAGGSDAKDVRLQLATGLASAGTSITVTSVTDLLAFAISGTTVIPALSWFCVWAAIAVTAVFMLSCTFFAALLVLDHRRQVAGRMDCLVCVKVAPGPDGVAPYEAEVPGCCCCCLRPNMLARFIENVFAPTLMKPVVKGVVVLAFIALAVVSGFGAAQIKQEFRREWFLPGDSYLQEFYSVQSDYFSDVGVPVSVYATDMDLYANRAALLKLAPLVRANKWIDTDADIRDWVAAFKTELQSKSIDFDTTDRSTFESELGSFLSNPGYARYKDDVVWQSGSTSVATMARIRAFYIGMDEAESEVAAMNSLKADVAAWVANEGVAPPASAFPFSFLYVSWSLFEVVESETFQNIGLALGAVFLVVLLFLADLVIAVMVVITVALVLLNVLGLMVYWGVGLDSVSLVNLVLSIGLAVDYSCHIAHSFMHKQGSREERAKQALSEMGVSVINGATSTFLAVCLLGFSKSYIFTVFFKMFFLSCATGALHGLVLLPVVLSFIGPSPHAEAQFGAGDASPKSVVADPASGGGADASAGTRDLEMATLSA